ncbi:L,D-transpeptidase family protein [Sphingomonas sp.]|uniref:L,D-transpeptidase family protein n=1 Tax=Sphingomonas sp. TaxID=28214 RepID=UPI002DB69932|nr:L,D-transpeptidase family protein [Sphingomonas sp.]HEU4969833.1 L,D-transpeptidase family protein [Sphingomonas sp.]
MHNRVCGAFIAALMLAAPAALRAGTGPDAVALEVKSEVGGKLKPVYAARGFWPLWIRNGAVAPAADRLIAYLETAELDGLEPRDYDVRDVREAAERARGGSPEALARAEIALSQAFARYVRDVRRAPNAKIRYLDEELVPQKLSEAEALRGASLARDIGAYVTQMGWMDPAYAGLRQALAERRERWDRLPSVDIPRGTALRVGKRGERVRLLRDRLGLPPGERFDKAVAAAVTDFQAAHGLKPDGIVGAGTIAALNRNPGWYDRVLTLNLDRARVLPGPDVRHITVNEAAQQLVYYDDGMEAGRMKVIVGKPGEQTPLLAGMVRYAILNPYWNVPPDLVQHKAASGVFARGTLQKAGFEALSDWSAHAERLDPSDIDWKAVASGEEQLRVRQMPGPSNAMGKVKFMFPNDLGIYLHDTPERALFDRNPRYFSSGCVRLEDAERLGEWLFGKPLVAKSNAPEQTVALPRPVPVYLTYLTAEAADGRVLYLDDAYGRDGADTRQVASR